MSTTGLPEFDATVQKTNEWLKRLIETEGWTRRQAYQALHATLHALRDRLPIDEMAQLSAQLPMLVRGFFFEGWDPSVNPARLRTLDAFLARIDAELASPDAIEPEKAARAVFRLLDEQISEGEMEDVRHVLPSDLRELWRAPAAG
jgi:uncharacterized protein (DUF2267 family)